MLSRPFKNFRLFSAGLALLAWLGQTACQSYQRANLLAGPKVARQAEIRDHYILFLLFDGARMREIDAGVARGELPTFEKLFYQEGAIIDHALTVFPTASSPSHLAFYSGLFPGHHGVPALDWFSRPLERYIDFLSPANLATTQMWLFDALQFWSGRITQDGPQSIFQQLKGYPTFSVFEPMAYGSRLYYPQKLPVVPAYHSFVSNEHEAWDFTASHYALEHFKKTKLEDFPRLAAVCLYGSDFLSHFATSKSRRMADLYIHYDRILQEMIAHYQRLGIWDKTTVIVVSDHGQHELEDGFIDLRKIFWDIGFRFSRARPSQSPIMWADHAVLTSQVDLKWQGSWQKNPRYKDLRDFPVAPGVRRDLIATLLSQKDIEGLVAPDGPWRRHLHFKQGHALIERRWDGRHFTYAYQVVSGQDPLGYDQDPQISLWMREHRFVDAEAWLKATYRFEKADAVVGLSPIFDDYRSGDLVLLARKGKQFKKSEPSGHGSLYAEDKHSILMLHGPDIKAGHYPYARTVDTYHWMLALFGLKSSLASDGILRTEIFLPSLRNYPLAEAAPPSLQAPLDLKEFGDFLKNKLHAVQTPKLERDKAQQLLYQLERFQHEQQEYPMP